MIKIHYLAQGIVQGVALRLALGRGVLMGEAGGLTWPLGVVMGRYFPYPRSWTKVPIVLLICHKK